MLPSFLGHRDPGLWPPHPPLQSPPCGLPPVLRLGPRHGCLDGRRRGPHVRAALGWAGVLCHVRPRATGVVPRGGSCHRGQIISSGCGPTTPPGSWASAPERLQRNCSCPPARTGGSATAEREVCDRPARAAAREGGVEAAELLTPVLARLRQSYSCWRWERKLTTGTHLAVKGQSGPSCRRGREGERGAWPGSFIFS